MEEIGGFSIAGMAIFIERLIHLRRAETNTNQFLVEVRRAIRDGNTVDAVQTCEATGGSVANIVRAGLLKYNRAQSDIEGAMEMQGIVEVANLEQNAKILSIIAHIAPLVGLLGTVLGFNHFVPVALEQRTHQPPKRHIVVNDQNLSHSRISISG